MYICIYVYIYIMIYTYNIHIHIYINIYSFVCVCVRACVCVHQVGRRVARAQSSTPTMGHRYLNPKPLRFRGPLGVRQSGAKET